MIRYKNYTTVHFIYKFTSLVPFSISSYLRLAVYLTQLIQNEVNSITVDSLLGFRSSKSFFRMISKK